MDYIDTLVVGGGQAGLAMSEHLSNQGIDHLVLEKARIAERWRTDRWDTLVANGPAWHDRFPTLEFSDVAPQHTADDAFPTKQAVVAYFETFAERIKAPVRCGVEVKKVTKKSNGRFLVKTSEGDIEARNVVAATGPFQRPSYPNLIPTRDGLDQIHSTAYKRPQDLAPGAVLVVGAGSSGSQIADELNRSGRTVYLSVGPHERPPRSYRGKDFVWWLGVLGKWEAKTPPAGKEHTTIAVSGANGGETIDFRRLSEEGINLLGMTKAYDQGILEIADDLVENVRRGDENYLSVLEEADAYISDQGLNFPPEPSAKIIRPDPPCLTDPKRQLDLQQANIKTIIWATGFTQDFGWLDVDTFSPDGKPLHKDGVSQMPGVYFLGLPWLSMRGSSFIWGVWVDAKNLAGHIKQHRT